MAVYTVHEPPALAVDPLAAERLVFVRDGFSLWAFLFAPLWMLWHRLWLVLVSYLILSAGIAIASRAIGSSTAALAFAAFLISLLVGLEASTLRRLTLTRRSWANVGVVSGDDQEDAERRFFGAWLRVATAQRGAVSTASAPPPGVAVAVAVAGSVPRSPPPPGVIGLFPEPGVRR